VTARSMTKHFFYWPTACAILLTAVWGSVQSTKPPHKIEPSLRYSCLGSPFLSVSASTPNQDSPPTVKLTLIDPSGRAQPPAAGHGLILKSRYAEVVELPRHPERSEVLAIEICDPQQGTYRLKVEESGNQPYRIRVNGDASSVSESQVLKHNCESGRIRNYYFAFWIEKKEAHIQWLNEAGRPQDPRKPIEIGEW
jgi:hypothetical protein